MDHVSDSLSSDSAGGYGLNSITRIMGFSFFASLLGTQSDSLASNSAKLFILGTLAELGRRFCQWLYERFNIFQFSVTAQFDEGDPIYEWVTLFLTEREIWKRSRHFHVSSSSSKRKWGIKLATASNNKPDRADYVPTFELPQLFKWNGYWAEIKRSYRSDTYSDTGDYMGTSGRLNLTIYTRDMSTISSFVEDARSIYVAKSRPRVIVYTSDTNTFGPTNPWITVKSKMRRSLESIVLQQGVIQALLEDAQEFLSMEDWYIQAGIPYRRGYLLHGPPGTGKTSTIYALAGELGLEIYSLSLSSSFVDDSFLQRAVSAIPKSAIFVLEDIDCAFPSREDEDEQDNFHFMPGPTMALGRRQGNQKISNVTLSGLLNVLDGIGSEEGKLFFATTNYFDRLDPALIRPGRIDRKIQYNLSTKEQAKSLFERFYPLSTFSKAKLQESATTSSPLSEKNAEPDSDDHKQKIGRLASQFSALVPEEEFSTAELQGYLLSCKREPERAVAEVDAWIEQQRKEREEKRIREEERKEKRLERDRQLMNMNARPMVQSSLPPVPDGAPLPMAGVVDGGDIAQVVPSKTCSHCSAVQTQEVQATPVNAESQSFT